MVKKIISIQLTAIFIFACSLCAYGKVQVQNIKYFDVNDKNGKIVITLKGNWDIEPKLKINSYMIQIELKDTYVWPKIEQKVQIGDHDLDSTIMAYQYTKDIVRIRAIFPYKLDDIVSQVKLKKDGRQLVIHFPKKSFNKSSTVKKKDNLNEDFLNELISQSKDMKKEEKGKIPGGMYKDLDSNVSLKLSSLKKDPVKKETSYLSSFSKQMIKFVFFTFLVIGLFYFLVNLVKKGVVGRSKLGFLNNSPMVTILSNNYIAPKRSLVTVKVHNQIFLLSSSESGISFLAEINDTSGFVKEGEKYLTGKNFDTAVDKSNQNESIDSKVKLKNNIEESGSLPHEIARAKEKVTFSEQLRKKVRGLRPLS